MIYKYEILNPKIDKKKPRLDQNGTFIVPAIKKVYKYYIDCALYNNSIATKEYYFLLGTDEFDEQCKRCRIDDYGRLKITLAGEMKEHINDIAKYKGNIQFTYIKSEDGYDVFKVS